MSNSHTLRLNGAAHEIHAGATLLELIVAFTGHPLRSDGSRVDGGRLGVAAAVGGIVVPRGRWAVYTVDDSDEIEIVTAVQGG